MTGHMLFFSLEFHCGLASDEDQILIFSGMLDFKSIIEKPGWVTTVTQVPVRCSSMCLTGKMQAVTLMVVE